MILVLFDFMLHHVASYHGLRVLNHFQFIAQRSIYFSLPALGNWAPFGFPQWLFLLCDVSSSCLGAERAGGSWLRGLVSSYMICTLTWSHFLKFLWSRVATSFSIVNWCFLFHHFFSPDLYCVSPVCFLTGRGACLEQIPTSELSDFDGLRKERVHDLSG